MAFSHIEALIPGGRRASDGLLGNINAFFSRARESILYELHDEPEAGVDADLENEI